MKTRDLDHMNDQVATELPPQGWVKQTTSTNMLEKLNIYPSKTMPEPTRIA